MTRPTWLWVPARVRRLRPRDLEPLVLAVVAQAHRGARDPDLRADRAVRHQRVVRPEPHARVDARRLDGAARSTSTSPTPRRGPDPVEPLYLTWTRARTTCRRPGGSGPPSGGDAEHELGVPRPAGAALPAAGGARRRGAPTAARDHDDGPAGRSRCELHRRGARRLRRASTTGSRRSRSSSTSSATRPRIRSASTPTCGKVETYVMQDVVPWARQQLNVLQGRQVHDGRGLLERRRVRRVLRREVPRGLRQHARGLARRVRGRRATRRGARRRSSAATRRPTTR